MSSESVSIVLDKMDTYLEKIGSIISEHSGQAVELGLTALRVDALSHLMGGFVALLLCVVSGLALYKLFTKVTEITREEILDIVRKGYRQRCIREDIVLEKVFGCRSRDVASDKEVIWAETVSLKAKFFDSENFLHIISAMLLSVTSVTSFGIALIKLSSVWTWVGAFYPELYAIHKFLM